MSLDFYREGSLFYRGFCNIIQGGGNIEILCGDGGYVTWVDIKMDI